MKYIFCLFSMFFFAKECTDKNSETETLKSAEDDITIIYEATSRGFFEEIQVSKTSLRTTSDRNKKQYTTSDTNPEDWKEILSLLAKIDAEKIKTLEAPSSKRLHDGAAHAVLKIKYKDNEVSSNSFDHGNPPKELAALLTKIQAMVKAVDKQ